MSGGRFQKGSSGNPGGRPRAPGEMARLIRTETKGGKELVDYALKVYRDPASAEANKRWAHDWLSDRGFGKAVQAIDLHVAGENDDGDDIDYTKLSQEELDQIIAEAEGSKPVPATAAAAPEPLPESSGDAEPSSG